MLTMEAVVGKVRACVEYLAGREVASDEPLMDAGLDSLTAVEARSDLSRTFDVSLPATALFDYPTVAAMATHIAARLIISGHRDGDATNQGATAEYQREMMLSAEGRDVGDRGSLSLATITAWASAGGGDHFSNNAVQERPRQTPKARWDLEAARSFDRESGAALTASKSASGRLAQLPAAFGAFLDSLEMFDPELFAVSAAEAVIIDVQQRLVLDATAAMALSYPPASTPATASTSGWFSGGARGVYVGIASRDYDLVLASGSGAGAGWGGFSASASALAATASFGSVAPGRVSFTFGLTGPAVAFDTACSSSLVAAKSATSDISCGDWPGGTAGCGAVVVGVNAMLAPNVTEVFRAAGMLSPSGRCKTLDISADGYVRGEDCRAFLFDPVLPSPSAVSAHQATATPFVCVTGAAVNQDGRSSSLTAPNGPSQQAVIRAAMSTSVPAPTHDRAATRVLQMHGTGTPLGDPIEVGATSAVFFPISASSISPSSYSHSLDSVFAITSLSGPLLMEASKAWAGHAEPAAGALGLVALCEGVTARHARGLGCSLRHLNPHVSAAAAAGAMIMSRQASALPTTVVQAAGVAIVLGGVSAFAFQGTNAHVTVVIGGGTSSHRGGGGAATVMSRRRCWAAVQTHPVLISVALDLSRQAIGRFSNLGNSSSGGRGDGCVAHFIASDGVAGPSGAAFFDHRVSGRALFPAAGMLQLCFDAASAGLSPFSGANDTSLHLSLLGAVIPAPLIMSPPARVKGANRGGCLDVGDAVVVCRVSVSRV